MEAVQKLIYDVREVAEILGLSRPTVYELLHRAVDPLPFFKIGNRTKISAQRLAEWVARQSGTE